MDEIVVVDMQVGLLNGEPKYDLQGVIERINLLAAMVRRRSGKVAWVRHCGKVGIDLSHTRPDGHSIPSWSTRTTTLSLRRR